MPAASLYDMTHESWFHGQTNRWKAATTVRMMTIITAKMQTTMMMMTTMMTHESWFHGRANRWKVATTTRRKNSFLPLQYLSSQRRH